MMKLNKIAFIVAIIAFFGTTASAQWYLGPRVGANLMMINTDGLSAPAQVAVLTGATYSSSTNSLIGFHGGATVRKQLSKQINVQADVLYSQMGGQSFEQVDFSPTFLEIENNFLFSYVQVPIYANIEFPIKPKKLVPYFVKESFSSFHLYGGGYFGYALSAENEVTVTTYSDNELVTEATTTTSLADTSYNPIDFGIMAGLGFSFRLDEEDKQRLGFDARYLLGLSNLSTVEGVTTNVSALQFSVFYTFKLTNRRYIRYTR